jgi:sec-independent protein translocase protein TatC
VLRNLINNGFRAAGVNDDKRMELTEHLGELRTRIIRSLLILIVGATVAYHYFEPLYGMLYRPLQKEMAAERAASAHGAWGAELVLPVPQHEPPNRDDYMQLVNAVKWIYDHPPISAPNSIVFRNFHEPFLVRLQVSIIYGFILVLPFVVWELGGFITPALTPNERKPLKMLLPLSAVLLAFGVSVAYATMFFAMHWFMSYLLDFPQPAVLMQDPNDYVMFFVKMMAAFGLAFQLPVVLMGMGFLDLVTSRGLLKNWKWGVVIAVLGGILTPSNDLPSMALMAFPLLGLYFMSIGLVYIVERSKRKPQMAP